MGLTEYGFHKLDIALSQKQTSPCKPNYIHPRKPAATNHYNNNNNNNNYNNFN